MKGLMLGLELMKQEERRLRRLAGERAVTVAVWAAIVALLIVCACAR